MTLDLDVFQDSIWQIFFIFTRIGAMVFFLPGLAESYVPPRVKLAVAISLTAIVTPIIWSDFPTYSVSQSTVFINIIIESTIGVFWGFIIRLALFSLQIAGSIMSQATSLAQIFGGTANTDAQPAMAHLLAIGGIALLSIFGFHSIYLEYIINTYAITPPGQFLGGLSASNFGGSQVARTFALAFQISAAVLVASLLYNIILGVINRAMPQLMVSFVGAPAITAGGLLMLLLMAPVIYDVWLKFVEQLISIPSG